MKKLFDFLYLSSVFSSFISGLIFIYLSKSQRYINSVVVDIGHDLGFVKIRRLNRGGIILCVMSFFLFIAWFL